MQPAVAVQHAPWLFGQGLGLQVWPGKKLEPAGHWVWKMKAQLPATPGMQHAPRGTCGQGFGEHGAFRMNVPPSATHSERVVETQISPAARGD